MAVNESLRLRAIQPHTTVRTPMPNSTRIHGERRKWTAADVLRRKIHRSFG